MNQVRLGVIGCGGMFRYHAKYFASIPELRFTAGCDIEPTALKFAVDTYGVEGFTDGHALLESGLVDAVLIATPHYFHPVFATAALKRGIHVLSEKPVAVTAQAAAEVNRVHAQYPKALYAVMFNQRTYPAWRKVKELIDAGTIGDLVRLNWVVTSWYRPQAYYNSGGWRATWAGEGGGVLINQCPHNLDLLQWFTGLPKRVTAVVGVAKHHRMETEDEVTAILEYASGATGVFITSTGEAPGTNRLEIAGTKGKLVTEGGATVTLHTNSTPTPEFTRTATSGFTRPECIKTVLEVDGDRPDHQAVTRNFIDAILNGTPLLAPGEEGIKSLELSNAMLMSGLTGKPVDLPTDHAAYDALIRSLAAQSTFRKEDVKPLAPTTAWTTH